MADTISQPIGFEDDELRVMLADAESLRDRVATAFKRRFALEQEPTYVTGGNPARNPAYDQSERSFQLNWANSQASALVASLRQATQRATTQKRHWYAKDRPVADDRSQE